MSRLTDLPADEASTLRLLASGKKPSDVADALSVKLDAVMSRAQRGADALAGSLADELAEGERSRVVSAIFGMSPDEPLLKSSPAAQAYANAVRSALNMPSTTSPPALPKAPSPPAVKQPTKTQVTATKPAVPTPKSSPASSTPDRTRGIILLACLVVVGIAIAIALISPGGGSDKPASTAATTSTTATGTNGWQIRNRFTLKAVDGGSGKALAGIETKGEASALLIAGNGLQAGSTVGIWLVGGKTSGLIGFQTVNSKGQFSAVGPLPKNLQTADTLVVTKESVKPGQKVPTTPGPVILSSPFSLS